MPRAIVGERKSAGASPLLLLMSAAAPVCELETTTTPATPAGEAETILGQAVAAAAPAARPRVADCHVHGHHSACECPWHERVAHFDWLHILVEINVHILLHAVLVILARKAKKHCRRHKHKKAASASSCSSSA